MLYVDKPGYTVLPPQHSSAKPVSHATLHSARPHSGVTVHTRENNLKIYISEPGNQLAAQCASKTNTTVLDLQPIPVGQTTSEHMTQHKQGVSKLPRAANRGPKIDAKTEHKQSVHAKKFSHATKYRWPRCCPPKNKTRKNCPPGVFQTPPHQFAVAFSHIFRQHHTSVQRHSPTETQKKTAFLPRQLRVMN